MTKRWTKKHATPQRLVAYFTETADHNVLIGHLAGFNVELVKTDQLSRNNGPVWELRTSDTKIVKAGIESELLDNGCVVHRPDAFRHDRPHSEHSIVITDWGPKPKKRPRPTAAETEKFRQAYIKQHGFDPFEDDIKPKRSRK